MEENISASALTVVSDGAELAGVLDFISASLEKFGCPLKVQMRAAVAAEEVFANKVQFAYGGESGDVTVECALAGNAVTVKMTDFGPAYNPLLRRGEETEGIATVRSSVDSLVYEDAGGNALSFSVSM